jgi:hypothetical protein
LLLVERDSSGHDEWDFGEAVASREFHHDKARRKLNLISPRTNSLDFILDTLVCGVILVQVAGRSKALSRGLVVQKARFPRPKATSQGPEAPNR